jgi:glc operon protein GlcG
MYKYVLIATLILATVPASSMAQQAPAAPAAPVAAAPAAPPPAYGPLIGLAAAKKAMAAAEAEAAKNNWPVAIAVVDSAGQLVLFQRQENTQIGSIDVAIGKAKTANDFRRPTKVLENAIAGGGAGLRLLSIRNLSPLEGGVPIIADGKIIGAVGVSGVLSSQDAQVAQAGADAAVK